LSHRLIETAVSKGTTAASPAGLHPTSARLRQLLKVETCFGSRLPSVAEFD